MSSSVPDRSGRECAVAFQLLASTVAVLAPDRRTADLLAELFPEYASVGTPPAHAAYRLGRAEGTEWEFEDRAAGASDRFASFADVLEAVEYLITLQLLKGARDATHLHASGAVVGNHAVLMLGPSGAGKSTLALGFSAAGFPVLGDDVVFIDPEGMVHPFKRLFDVREQVVSAHGVPRVAVGNVPAGEDGVWYDPRSGGGWATPAVPGVVALANYRPGSRTSLRNRSSAECLNLLLESRLPSGLGGSESFATLATLAQRVRSVEMTFGDVADGVAALRELG